MFVIFWFMACTLMLVPHIAEGVIKDWQDGFRWLCLFNKELVIAVLCYIIVFIELDKFF